MDASPQSELLKRDSVLAEILRRLVDAYQPRRVYLFGSKARGDEGPDSDYDLLIVVADDAPADRRKNLLAHKSLWGIRTAADVLVCTEQYFDSRRTVVNSVPATVMREGRLLYAA
jgi:predicted nucleotidyltransferase